MLLEFSDPSGMSAIVEDDGRVAYAYLRDEGGKICGDVWLYNVGPPPDGDEWRESDARERAPFRNSARYCSGESVESLTRSDDVDVRFLRDAAGRFDRLDVHVRGVLHAVLRRGSRPGWCRLARRDGPLARILIAD